MLAALIAIGSLGCAANDLRDEHATAASSAVDRAADHAPATTLPPWNASEKRFCPLAALSVPLYLQEASRLEGAAEERALAVEHLRDWSRRLAEAAPPEIAESVATLTQLSNRSYEVLERGDSDGLEPPDLRAARSSPAARRAQQQAADYMKRHCGIDFDGT